jgi:hypothetical protein
VRKNIRKEETTNSDSLKEQVYIVDTSPQASSIKTFALSGRNGRRG